MLNRERNLMTKNQLILALQNLNPKASDQILVKLVQGLESFLYVIDDVHIDDGHIMIKVKEEMI